jgi:hypothetical protein
MHRDLQTSDNATMQEMVRIMMAHHFALRVAVTSLLRTHPEAEAALTYFDTIAESLRAMLLNSDWSEARLEEFEANLAGLRRDLNHKTLPPSF